MERILFRFTKGDLIRFVGHLDLMRMVERAMRRSGFPIRYTEGFNPRPRMSFASALTLGATSDGELCQLDLATDLDTETVRAAMERLRAQLPQGLLIQEVWEIPLEKRNPFIQVEAAEYELTFTGAEAQRRVREYLRGRPESATEWELTTEERGAAEIWLRLRLPAGERAKGTGVRIRDVVAGMEQGAAGTGEPPESDLDQDQVSPLELETPANAQAPVRLTRLHRTRLWCEQTPQQRV